MHFGTGGSRQSTADLENPLRIGIALSVQRQSAGQSGRRRKAVDPRSESHSAQILAGQVGATGRARRLIVCHGETLLRLGRHRFALEE